MKVFAVFSFFFALLFAASPAWAQAKMSGNFVANAACPAVTSIHKGTNPGNVLLTVGTTYKILGGNTDNPTYYWIVVPAANPDHRWVPVTCGTAALDATTPPTPAPGKTQYVFAASWEPAFCELPGMDTKTECKGQTATSFEASHFALHGLWPQPRSNQYCGVSATDTQKDDDHKWSELPAVNLSITTRAELNKVMPGTQSDLERHEWITHGTCYGADQEEYFSDALAVMNALNASPVRDLFASNIGKTLTLAQIRAAFDSAFGSGAGERVRVACAHDGSRDIIEELTIGLTGTVEKPAAVGPLLLAAGSTSGGCPTGVVDAVGPQ